MTSSPNTMSPSRNSISNWLKLLKKSDSSNELSSSQNSSMNLNPSNLDLNDYLTNNTNNTLIKDSSLNTSNTNTDSNINNNNNNNNKEIIDSKRISSPIPIKIIANSNISPRKNSNPLSLNLLSPQKSSQSQSQSLQHNSSSSSSQQLLSSSPTPSRPFLGFKSRSSHSFRPLSQFLDSTLINHQDIHVDTSAVSSLNSNIDGNSKEKLRSHRDSFLQQRQLDAIGNSSIFGCDIETSTKLAHGTIYISGDINNNNNNKNNNNSDPSNKDNNNSNVAYGQVPLVIVSCGSYLKANALNVEGIFRLSGSNKRVKHLQMIFSTPPDYGAKIDWDGYTVHDAASLLRRFLGSLSEPLIPFNLYQSFRNPLIEKKELYQYLKEKDNKNSSYKKPDKQKRHLIISQRRELLKEYSILFNYLPPIQHRVLFYLVDMLAMFNLRSDKNRMPAKNLAAIFQPSILFHPDHDMNPDEYASNSLVIEFMITYSHKILVNVHKPNNINNKEKITKLNNDSTNSNDEKISTTKKRKESLTLSKMASDDCEKIEEEVNEPDELETQNKEINNSDDTNKPKIIIESNSNSSLNLTLNKQLPNSKHIYLSSDKSSSLKGSPLKNMFTPLDDRNELIAFHNLNAPATLFTNSTNSRPHSKSLSYTPHSEVVRIQPSTSSISSNNKGFNANDDNLSRIVSNQSGISSLLSSKLDTDITTSGISQSNINQILGSSSDNNLVKELGLPQPDMIHKTELTSNDSTSQTSSLSNGISHLIIENDKNLMNLNKPTIISPITPTTDSAKSKDNTPDSNKIEKLTDDNNKNNDMIDVNYRKENIISHMDDLKYTDIMSNHNNNNNNNNNNNYNIDETDSKEEFYSLRDSGKQSYMSTTSAFESRSLIGTNDEIGRSSNSLPFSFQPSLLQGHRSADDVNSFPKSHILPTKKVSAKLQDFKKVQYSHPDITDDPSSLHKTATTPSIGSINASINTDANNASNENKIKKRSNSVQVVNNKTNKTNGTRDFLSIVSSRKGNSTTNKNIVSSSENITLSKEKEKNKHVIDGSDKGKSNHKEKSNEKVKEKGKEKHTWFDKFKPRSNSKR